MTDQFVSIIVPVHNQWGFTRACLDALARCTPEGRYEVIVMDNDSTDATQAEMAKYPHVKYLRDDEKIGFARANNVAARQAAAAFLCFLNNDAEVTPHWLEPLVSALCADSTLAAVGPRLLFPEGTIEEAGIVFNCKGGPYHFGARWRAAHPHLTEPMFFNALTAACLLCRREDFQRSGGFNEQYVNGYEDVDLCLTWRKAGRRLLHVPESVVIHHEGSSEGRHDREMENLRLFFSRWGGTLVQDDLSYYIRAKAPHASLPFIAVIVAGGTAESLQVILLNMLKAGDCALSVLCITDGRDVEIARLNEYGPLITVVSDGDDRGIVAWISRQTAVTGFAGCLIIKSPVLLSDRWDVDLCECPQRSHGVVPLWQDSADFQSWLRFFCNIPAERRRSLADARDYLRQTFRDVGLLANVADETAVFLPKEMVLDSKAIADHASGRARGGKASSVLPQWMLMKNEIPTDAVPAAMIAVTFDCFDDDAGRTVDSLLQTTAEREAEIILVKLKADNGPIEPELEQLCARHARVACFLARRPLDAYRGRNIASAATAASVVVFAQSGVRFSRGWLPSLLESFNDVSTLGAMPKVLRDSMTIAQAGVFSDAAGSMGAAFAGSPRSDHAACRDRLCPAMAGPCIAFRRVDFLAAGGFIEKTTGWETAIDACRRVSALRQGGFVYASASEVFISGRSA